MGGRGSAGGASGVVPKAGWGEIMEVIKLPSSISPSTKHTLLTTKYGLTPAEATAALKEAGLL